MENAKPSSVFQIILKEPIFNALKSWKQSILNN
jgi:hypothetical protein